MTLSTSEQTDGGRDALTRSIESYFSAALDRRCVVVSARNPKSWEVAYSESLKSSSDPSTAEATIGAPNENRNVGLLKTRSKSFVVVTLDEFFGEPTSALIAVDDQPHQMLLRLARISLDAFRARRQVEEQQALIDGFAGQVSQDFEEVTWLRELVGRLEYCDASSSLNDAVQGVVGELRHIVAAQSLAFVVAEPCPHVIHCDGDRDLLSQVWERLIAEGKAKNSDDRMPNVCNTAPTDPEGLLGFPDLRSYVVVQAMHKESVVGWLVALNRLPRSYFGTTSDSVWDAFSEQEFGTIEGSLLNAAATMLATHTHNAGLFREKEELLVGVIRALIDAIDAKDTYTCGHSDRVALIAKRLAQVLKLDVACCERIYMAGLLHDIGKIGVPDDVLRKPGRLTDDEFALIKRHPTIGHAIMKHVPQLQYVLPGVLHHHESMDGRGYPFGLRGEQIPLEARILAVADAYDAMTSSRPYREAMPLEKAARILREGAGTQWDADVIDAIFAVWDEVRTIGITSTERGQSIHDREVDHDPANDEIPNSLRTAVAAVH